MMPQPDDPVAAALRPVVLSLMQSLQAAACIIGGWLLLMRTERAALAGAMDAVEIGHRLRFAAASCISVAVPATIAASGLWQNKPWAYRLTILVTVAGIVLPLGGLFGSNPDWRVLWIILPFAAQLLFALHPETRQQLRQLWKKR